MLRVCWRNERAGSYNSRSAVMAVEPFEVESYSHKTLPLSLQLTREIKVSGKIYSAGWPIICVSVDNLGNIYFNFNTILL